MDYRGIVYVCLWNINTRCESIRFGDRIAQMKINKLDRFELVDVSELSQTVRGDGGFGSTDKS